jgi:hypothetical protein
VRVCACVRVHVCARHGVNGVYGVCCMVYVRAGAYLRMRMKRTTWLLSTWSFAMMMHAMAMPVRP